MSGNALAIALALLRAPSMRMALRQRPLPGDVCELIELAAGEPGRVATAAAGAGETQGQVLEAARFYVREILLFADADAYRVLGVAPGADPARIKQHYRHLQRWLHPDRRGNDWESVYATRVNAAWAELRSPARRAAYDARHPQAGMASGRPPASHRVLVSSWRAAPFRGHRGMGWLALGAGVACCVWLAVLVDRQVNGPAPEWNHARDEAPQETTPAAFAATVDVAIEPASAVPQAAPVASKPAPAAPEVEAYALAPAMATPPAVASGRERPATVVHPSMPAANTPGVEDRVPAKGGETSPAPPAAPPRPAARVQSQSPPPSAPLTAAIEAAPALVAAVAPPPVAITPERVLLARRCGSELTRYLASDSGRVPPIWRSVAAQDAAASIRARLNGESVRFGAPEWRIGADHASMSTTLRRAGTPAVLRAEFAWRDGMWLVEHLHAENLP